MTGDVLADELAEIAELEKPGTEAPKAADPALKPQTEEPQAEEAEAPEEAEADNEGQFVRKGDFKALRLKAEAAERAKQEMEARYAADMARLNERLAIIAQQTTKQQEPQQQAPQIPDINTDPIGHFQAKQEILERKLQEAEGWRKQTQQVTQQQEVLQKIGTEVSRLEQEFAKTTPDYAQAQQHLFESWAREAQLMGAAPEEAIRFWSMQIVQRAGQQNKNPAQVAYELAKQRGYAGPAPKPQAQAPQGPNLDTIQRGLAVSKSTSAAPGKAAPSGTPTIEALLQMDDEEFAKNYGSRDAAKWQSDMEKIMGLR
jgi:hypothetical protein